MIRHTRTDPACIHYREPRTWLGRWWFDRARGRGCGVCVPPRGGGIVRWDHGDSLWGYL